MISKTAEYALRAASFFARNPGKVFRISTVAAQTHIPREYLAKILLGLSRKTLLKSQKGPGGGFSLAFDPRQTTFLDVINAVDPIVPLDRCPVKATQHHGHLCLFHAKLRESMIALTQALEAITIEEVIHEDPSRQGCPIPRNWTKATH